MNWKYSVRLDPGALRTEKNQDFSAYLRSPHPAYRNPFIRGRLPYFSSQHRTTYFGIRTNEDVPDGITATWHKVSEQLENIFLLHTALITIGFDAMFAPNKVVANYLSNSLASVCFLLPLHLPCLDFFTPIHF